MFRKILTWINIYWKTIGIIVFVLIFISYAYFQFIAKNDQKRLQPLPSKHEFKDVEAIEIEIDGIDHIRVPKNAVGKISIDPNEKVNLSWEKKKSILSEFNMSLQMFKYLNKEEDTQTEGIYAIKGPFYLRYSRNEPKFVIALGGFICTELDYTWRETGGKLPAIPAGRYILKNSISNSKNFSSVYNEFPLVFIHSIDKTKGKVAIVPKNHPDNLLFKEAENANFILMIDNASFKLVSGLLLEEISYIELASKVDNLLKLKELLGPIK